MNIKNKRELRKVVSYERNLWIKRMYPNGSRHKIRNLTLLYMKALRIVEYYLDKSKIARWGGTTFGRQCIKPLV